MRVSQRVAPACAPYMAAGDFNYCCNFKQKKEAETDPSQSTKGVPINDQNVE